MTEHTIRLRGGWTWRAAGSTLSSETPLTLPVRSWPDVPARLILTRRFGRPRLDAGRETLWLRLDHVPGILAVYLNGKSIAETSITRSSHEIELPLVLERNVLILEIEVKDQRPDANGVIAEWGLISLVVRSVATVDDL